MQGMRLSRNKKPDFVGVLAGLRCVLSYQKGSAPKKASRTQML